MTYNASVEMGGSQSLMQRVAACAAEQGNTTPQTWAGNNLLSMAADSNFGWAAAWDYAKDNATVNNNPDIGKRDDVINDSMILSAVQSRKAAQLGSQGWPAS